MSGWGTAITISDFAADKDSGKRNWKGANSTA